MPKAYDQFGNKIPLEDAHFSGTFTLRLPKSLHKQAVRCAKIEGVSLNQWLVYAIARYTATREALERVQKDKE